MPIMSLNLGFERYPAAPPPEDRLANLNWRFRMATSAMVNMMLMRGASSFRPSLKRPGIDYVQVATISDGQVIRTIDLTAAKIWFTGVGDGYEPIGLVEHIEAEHLLIFYASTKIDRSRIKPEDLEALEDESKTEEQKRAIWAEGIQPVIQEYIEENRETLMSELVGDMSKAASSLRS